MKEMYQIGSVVEVVGSGKEIPLIIIGRLMQQPNGDVYDYIGLPYPYGFTGDKGFHAFSEDDIENVLFEGYKTDMSDELQLFYQDKYIEINQQNKTI